MDTGDENVELAAVAAYLGDPEWPCCPECLNLTQLDFDDVMGMGSPGIFRPGSHYQRIDLDSPATGAPDIVGDREGDCVHCGHRYLFRESVWLNKGDLSDDARQEVNDFYPPAEFN